MSVEAALVAGPEKTLTAAPALASLNGQDPARRALEAAFSRFTEASAKLEARYNKLNAETEELKARLKEKDAEIARSARLSMLGETAAAIAHEVRNPLGSIKLFVSILRQDLSDRPDSLNLVDEVLRSINTLDNVVTNILQFAKNQKMQPVPVNVQAVLQEQISRLLPGNHPDLSLQLEFEAAPFIQGSESGLRQVFYNLLLNAMQALRYRGTIKVQARGDADTDLRILIQDDGPGIASEILDRLFEPFVSGRNEGTGLGLAIVRRIVEQHGGTIRAYNQEGAVFEIVLPRRLEEERK